MKKLVSLLLAVSMLLGLASFAAAEDAVRVAMVTDSGDITDQSFNQTTYEACKAFCEANGIDFTYYKPAADSDPDRVTAIEMAINDGFNTIVLPGYLFGAAVQEVQDTYADVNFICLDISEFDLGGTPAANVFSAVYQEELSGYMAGYAAVKMGYKHLGFLGGMAVPAVIRFGFGFVQGADAAAVEMGIADQVAVEYVYGNQFFGDADITAYMDNWYQNLGVEVVFACGGGIYTSAAEAAVKVGTGKVIGVDTDQSGIINTYADGLTVTSAMKGLAATVNTLLTETVAGNFASYGGKVETLGLVSGDDMSLNYVALPETTQFSDSFTRDDYVALVKAMFDGTVTVSNDTTAMPATTVAVTDHGSVK
ncbi:MAG: BMP family protein [Aristaeellaceae bacterium]